MLRRFLHGRLNAEEKKLGSSMDYLRHVVDVSPVAMLRFASIMPFANSRKVLPKEPWFVAQIVAVQHEDCGPCVQITVNLARKSRVDPKLIQAALNGDLDEMSTEMVDVYQFTKSVVDKTYDEDELRDKMRKRYGDQGLIELAYVIAAASIPPTVKRVLGYAKSCSLVKVEV